MICAKIHVIQQHTFGTSSFSFKSLFFSRKDTSMDREVTGTTHTRTVFEFLFCLVFRVVLCCHVCVCRPLLLGREESRTRYRPTSTHKSLFSRCALSLSLFSLCALSLSCSQLPPLPLLHGPVSPVSVETDLCEAGQMRIYQIYTRKLAAICHICKHTVFSKYSIVFAMKIR